MKRTEAYRQFIEDKLRERYPTFLLHGRTSFQAPDSTILRIDTLNWAQEALVVEYAYDETWAENNVFEDGIVYDASTMEYLRALGSINVRLAEHSDAVVEVIAGIPVARKGELPSTAEEKQGHRQKGAPACP